MDFGSTTYIMLIGQFYKWLKMWLEAVLKLTTSSGRKEKMDSKWSLYLGCFSSYKLFQKSTLKSTTKSNLPHPRLAIPQAYFLGPNK